MKNPTLFARISMIIFSLCFSCLLFGQNQLGQDIDGEAASSLCGSAVALSGVGTRLAIGSTYFVGGVNVDTGHVKVYDWTGSSWNQVGDEINGKIAFTGEATG